MNRFRQLPATIVGQLGERAASAEFRRRGASVVASYQFSGQHNNHAPVLEFENHNSTLPDLDVSKRGRRVWVEVKTYEHAALNQTHGCYVHGVPVRLFDHYVAVEQETGGEVFLAVVEITSGLMLVSDRRLSAMPKYPCLCAGKCCSVDAERHTPGGRGVREMQWYFDRDDFTTRYALDSKTITHIRAEHARLLGGGAAKNPWTWACLSCNVTGAGPTAAHRCASTSEQVRGFWLRRLGWTSLAASQIAALLNAPIERSKLVELLGDRWSADYLPPWPPGWERKEPANDNARAVAANDNAPTKAGA